MEYRRVRAFAPALIVAIGAVLFLGAGIHHLTELSRVSGVAGPLTALALDGPPALLVVYAGYHLSRTEFASRDRWRVVGWSVGGGLVFVVAIGTTFLVRLAEGRVVAEPLFPLLIAVEAGTLAGFVAGYYNTHSRIELRRTRSVTDALSFVNDLIRHDLRNDLDVIQGHAELLEARRTDTTGDLADAPSVIVEQVGQAHKRIETTRAVTDTLVGDPELQPVDLRAITGELAEQTDTAYDATVTTEFAEDAFVRANAGIRSVVDNLLENAVEHNDRADPTVAVAVTVDGDTVSLSVSDNGPGIPDERKSELFEGSATGRGGLSLVRTLVEGYGGTIRVDDNEPRGTTVTAELPRADRQP